MLNERNAIPIMTSNTLPSGRAFASSIYSTADDAWKVFDGNERDTRWRSSNVSAWVGYEFTVAKKISSYEIYSGSASSNYLPKTWKFEGSNNGTSWDVLDYRQNETGWVTFTSRKYFIDSPKEYKQYRLNVSANNGGAGSTILMELKMNETYRLNKILFSSDNKIYSLNSTDTWYETNMTSNNAPTPLVASASNSNNQFPPYKAFDGKGVTSSDNWTTVAGLTSAWIQLDFGSKKMVNRLEIKAQSTINTAPKDFNILASNDGVDFTTLSEIRGQINWDANGRIFSFNNNSDYRYYRLEILKNNGNSVFSIREIVFGYIDTVLNEIAKFSTNSIVKYGMDSPIQVDGIFSNKSYILTQNDSKNTEGLWTTQLNRKPLSIKFD